MERTMKYKIVSLFTITILMFVCIIPVQAGDSSIFTLQRQANEVVLYVENARDLSAFEVQLSSATGGLPAVDKGQLLTQSSRNFSMLGPKTDSAGMITFGFFSIGTAAGLIGEGPLAVINCGGACGLMEIKGVKATDSKGNELPCVFLSRTGL
jgi:hypothetical protein